MRRFLFGAVTAAAAIGGLAVSEANARFYSPGFDNQPLVEQAACRVIRERITRPNGRVIMRTTRRCDPGVERCRVVRERVTRPNGNVVIRTVRRCR